MRVKDGYVMREVAGQGIVIATGEASKEFHGMVKLNDTGQLLWEALEHDVTREQLVERLLEVYDVDGEQAAADVDAFVEQMDAEGFLVR